MDADVPALSSGSVSSGPSMHSSLLKYYPKGRALEGLLLAASKMTRVLGSEARSERGDRKHSAS